MAEPTKLDHTNARKYTQKAADAAPLLALLGLTPVYTAQDFADRRERKTAEAAVWYDAKQDWYATGIAQARAETMALAGILAVAEVDRHFAESPFLSGAAPSTRWTIWTVIRQRAERGEPLFPKWTPAEAKPRAAVDPEAAYAVIAASPIPLFAAGVADALGGATVLDVAEAVRALREAGRVVTVERNGKLRGFTTAERAA